VKMKRIRGLALVLALVVALLPILVGGHYQSTYHRETVSGITLTTSVSMNHNSSMYWGSAYANASSNLEGIAARNRGYEYCNFAEQTDWDQTNWGFGRNWAAASGSGGYNTDWWDCLIMHDIVSSAWGYYRNWTWSPYLYETNGEFWVCEHLRDGYCYPKNWE